MKKIIILFTVISLSMAANGMCQKITNFSDWNLLVCPQNQSCQTQSGGSSGTISVSGSDWSVSMEINNGKLTFDVDGSEEQGIWTALRKDFGNQASIIISSVKVNDFSGNISAGFWHSIEEWPIQGILDDEVICSLRVQNWDGCRSFSWTVEERSDDRSYEKVLSRGKFGDYCEGWSKGQLKFLGYAMLIDQMFFVVDGYKSIHTFMPLVSFSSDGTDFDPALEVYVDQGDDNFINVEFDNVHVQ